ncbi:HAD-IA family hydrolase [Actinoplanes campanulatus]
MALVVGNRDPRLSYRRRVPGRKSGATRCPAQSLDAQGFDLRLRRPADGHRELDEAEGLGLRLAVASGSARSWVAGHLARTGDLARFEVLARGDEVAGHKPDPAVYRLALDRLGLPPEAAMAFEDTPHGVSAALAAGLRCVAIPHAYAQRSRFAHADLVLTTAASLPLAEVLTRAVATAAVPR